MGGPFDPSDEMNERNNCYGICEARDRLVTKVYYLTVATEPRGSN